MIRAFFRWMGEVLPPRWAIAIALALYLSLEALYGWWIWWVGIPDAGTEVLKVRDTAAGMVCAAYGAFRVLAFHPLFRPAYRRWLELSPWTSRKPLPVGAIRLVFQDLVLLLAVLLLLHDSQVRFVLVPSAFLGSYLVVLCLSLMLTGGWQIGYALAFGLGVAVRLGNQPVASLCVLAALYVPAYVGLRRALARFPWKMPDWWEQVEALFKPKRTEPSKTALGWPYDHLPFDLPDRLIPRKDGGLASLLAGWYLHAAASVMPDAEDPEAILAMAFFFCMMGCAVARTAAYCAVHRPPISFWGRIWTLRWIIPGYDQVLVAPICALLIGPAAVMSCVLGLPPKIVLPLGVSLMLLITMNMGPTMKRWRLTGNHRIAPGIRSSTLFEQL